MRYLARLYQLLFALFLITGCSQNNPEEPRDRTISLLTISGIVIPENNVKPGNATIVTDQYNAAILWTPSIIELYEPSTVYSATIFITPKEGWTLSGIKKNGFTVNGAETSNDANSGIITAVFPRTKPDDTISLLELTGIPIPVAGTPQNTIQLDTAQFSGTMSWTPDDSFFKPDTTYIASITIQEYEGWTASGLQENSFTVSGATTTFIPSTKTVRAVFPATGTGDYESPNIGNLKYVHVGSFQRDGNCQNISHIVKPYRMGETEITIDEFTAVTGYANPCVEFKTVGNAPVQYVNWYHVITFCNKLSIREGLQQVYRVKNGSTFIDFEHLAFSEIPTTSNADWDAVEADWSANGYRLPTEMEWMWAAMGATKDRSNGNSGSGANTTGYQKGYAGSSEAEEGQTNLGTYAWYSANSGYATHQVKTREPNEIGLYDMSGNVVEWCWDWGENYLAGSIYSDSDSGKGPASGTKREYRGGGFGLDAYRETVACREKNNTYYRSTLLGFRVVRQ